jgi:hypothetical protein
MHSVTDVILAWLWIRAYAVLLHVFDVLGWFEKYRRRAETPAHGERTADS